MTHINMREFLRTRKGFHENRELRARVLHALFLKIPKCVYYSDDISTKMKFFFSFFGNLFTDLVIYSYFSKKLFSCCHSITDLCRSRIILTIWAQEVFFILSALSFVSLFQYLSLNLPFPSWFVIISFCEYNSGTSVPLIGQVLVKF